LMAAFTTLEQHFQVVLISYRKRAFCSDLLILLNFVPTAIKRRFDKQ
jgi:hypothetical protein